MKQKIFVVDAVTLLTRVVVAVFADFIAFEATWNKSVADISTRITLSELSWLAWSCESRNKVTSLSFTDWCLTVDSVSLDDLSVPVGEVSVSENVIVPLESNLPIG